MAVFLRCRRSRVGTASHHAAQPQAQPGKGKRPDFLFARTFERAVISSKTRGRRDVCSVRTMAVGMTVMSIVTRERDREEIEEEIGIAFGDARQETRDGST